MSFETDLKKMQKMWDKSQQNAIDNQVAQIAQQTKTDQQTSDVPPIQLVINNLNDVGGAYKDISTLMTTPYQISGFDWTFTYSLPEQWIPMIRLDLAYNYTGTSGFDKVVVYVNKVVSIVPLSNGLVQATWLVNFYLVSYDPTVVIPDFQAKVYFVLIDPSQIV